VRGEVFRHFGYFMTESTGHLSEYVPWFRKNKDALDQYCDEPALAASPGAYYKWGKVMAEKYAEIDPLQFEATEITSRSVEYCSYILEAVTTGRPFRFMGNVRNDGYIANLPPGCCVEVPTYADDTGIHPMTIGALPPQCAAACLTNITVQTLCAEAALSGDPEHLGPRPCARPLDRRRLHPQANPRHGKRNAGSTAPLPAPVRRQNHPARSHHPHPRRLPPR
jgi:alpha-galactosidase